MTSVIYFLTATKIIFSSSYYCFIRKEKSFSLVRFCDCLRKCCLAALWLAKSRFLSAKGLCQSSLAILDNKMLCVSRSVLCELKFVSGILPSKLWKINQLEIRTFLNVSYLPKLFRESEEFPSSLLCAHSFNVIVMVKLIPIWTKRIVKNNLYLWRGMVDQWRETSEV